MAINRTVFYTIVRQNPFGGTLTQQNVDGTNAILEAWEKSPYSSQPIDGLGYILATCFGETGTMKWDVREIPAKGHTRESYFEAKYGNTTAIGKRLGNSMPGDGGKFYGRGPCQITGRANYTKFAALLGVDLVKSPDLALRKDIAAQIILHGMYRGLFTGRKLADYFDGKPADFNEMKRRRVQARRIINGQDKAETFARVAAAFSMALYAATRSASVLAAAAASAPVEGEEPAATGLLDLSSLPGVGDIPATLQDLAPSVLNTAVTEATGGKVKLPVDRGESLAKSTVVGGGLVAGVPGILATLASVPDKWIALAICVLIAGGVFLVISGRVKIKDEAGV